MDIYKINNIAKLIEGNSYVGRGIVIGKTEDGTKALTAYFIMGRSNNSRNRIFVENGDEVIIHPYDASKVEDPSLIIYSPIRKYENNLIVTNGDQTDTVYDGLKDGKSFSVALESREFEPDAPNFTPRISGMMTFANDDFTYQMSILKSADAEGTACNRFTYSYASLKGLGHFIHTYVCDGAPIPTFQGEPERVAIGNDIDAFTNELWNALDADNKISLYVRTIDLKTGEIENRMINKFEKV
ncbi:MAG: inosine monophosphate cyclohydrolase [Ruminococcaceae bacterium]|nr:inosine monophosphate cyclohydrolase [Oscillospiraceae bacterium]